VDAAVHRVLERGAYGAVANRHYADGDLTYSIPWQLRGRSRYRHWDVALADCRAGSWSADSVECGAGPQGGDAWWL